MSRTSRRKNMAYFRAFGSEAATFAEESGKFKTWYMIHSDDHYYGSKPARYWYNRMVPSDKDFRLFHSDKHKYCGSHYGKWLVGMNLDCKVIIGRSTIKQKIKMAVFNNYIDNFVAEDSDEDAPQKIYDLVKEIKK